MAGRVFSRRFTSSTWNVTLTLDAPMVLWMRGFFRSEFADQVQSYFRTLSEHFLEEAKIIYNFQPIKDRFYTVNKVFNRKKVQGGIGVNDPLFHIMEWDVTGHWPPFLRSNLTVVASPRRVSKKFIGPLAANRGRRKMLPQLETGMSKWAKEHGWNPYALARQLASQPVIQGKYSKGRGVTNLWENLQKQIPQDIIAIIEGILAE